MTKIKTTDTDWLAQKYINEEKKEEEAFYYGTKEEKSFIEFISSFIEKLRKKYSDIALLRNERFFQIFDFDEGRAFEPDFVLLLKEKNHKIKIYQVFIEPKGEVFAKAEPWKEKFLTEIESKYKLKYQKDIIMEIENKEFKLVSLPFYNDELKRDFEEALENKILN